QLLLMHGPHGVGRGCGLGRRLPNGAQEEEAGADETECSFHANTTRMRGYEKSASLLPRSPAEGPLSVARVGCPPPDAPEMGVLEPGRQLQSVTEHSIEGDVGRPDEGDGDGQ